MLIFGVPQITLEGSRDENLGGGPLSAPPFKVGQGCNISDITLTSGRLSGFRFYDYLEFGVGV